MARYLAVRSHDAHPPRSHDDSGCDPCRRVQRRGHTRARRRHRSDRRDRRDGRRAGHSPWERRRHHPVVRRRERLEHALGTHREPARHHRRIHHALMRCRVCGRARGCEGWQGSILLHLGGRFHEPWPPRVPDREHPVRGHRHGHRQHIRRVHARRPDGEGPAHRQCAEVSRRGYPNRWRR